jgi:hypothetical protein
MTKEYTKDDLDSVINRIGSDRENSIINFQQQVYNNYSLLYDKVKTENTQISNTSDGIQNANSANGQKSKYVYQSTQILQRIYGVLFWIYLVLAIGLSVVIYMFSKQGLYMKIFWILVILLFPFYIYPLETYVFEILRYLYSLTLSVVYVNNY